MAHNLATTNGKTAMAFYGETPWHGLGTALNEPATAAEAISAAGLDYQVELASLMTGDGTPVDQRKAVIRADNRNVLGVVGNATGSMANWKGGSIGWDRGLNKLPSFRVITPTKPAENSVASTRFAWKLGCYLIHDPFYPAQEDAVAFAASFLQAPVGIAN